MKSKLAILVLLSSAPWADAATTVPTLMSYQGRVTDSAGVAIGSTAAAGHTKLSSQRCLPSKVVPLSSNSLAVPGGRQNHTLIFRFRRYL